MIVSTHPRTQKRLEALDVKVNGDIRFLPALGFVDYVHLQMHACCTISDSGSITEESSILGFPAITVRQAHERPEGMDEATLIMTGLSANHILKSIEVVTARAQHGRVHQIVPDYDTENVSHKVLNIIMSYTEYVNRTVWKKNESERDFIRNTDFATEDKAELV